MAVQTVFSNNLNPQALNLTSRFTNASAFYIDAPLITPELEIDCFLQVYFPTENGENVRNLPLGKVAEQSILLNVTDTQSLVTIPSEYLDSGLEMAILFLASSTTFLEVHVLGVDCSLCAIDNKLNAVQETLDQIRIATANNNEPLLLELATQLLQLDAGLFTVAEGLSRLLPQDQRQDFTRTTARRLFLDRGFL